MQPVIFAENLIKSYAGHAVVNGINLALDKGECFGLLGPNGAGKTTTLRLLLGLTEPDSGMVSLHGEDVPRHAREARLHVGVVPQADNLDPDFSVAENLLVYGRYFGMSDGEIEARIPMLPEFAKSCPQTRREDPDAFPRRHEAQADPRAGAGERSGDHILTSRRRASTRRRATSSGSGFGN